MIRVLAKPSSVPNSNEPSTQEKYRKKLERMCLAGCCALFTGIIVTVFVVMDPLVMFDSSPQ